MHALGAESFGYRDFERPVGQVIADLAARQHGVISTSQLLGLGLSKHAIHRRARAGWLHPCLHEAYAVGHGALTPRGRLTAGLLACGEGAVLSHRSAALVWELRTAMPTIVDISVPRTRHSRPGIRIHRPRKLDARDVTEHDGFAVTTVTRTICDLAGSVSNQRLGDLWDSAMRRGLLDVERATELCGPGRRGARKVRRLIALTTQPDPTRSHLERRFAALCRKHRLPMPSFNTSLHGFEVDAYWPKDRLVVELDGYAFHKTRRAFERDRARDAALTALGLRVIRLTWRRLAADEANVVAELRTATHASQQLAHARRP